MIVRQNRNRWWVYLDPNSELEGQVLFEVFNRKADGRQVFPWVHDNAAGSWRYVNTIVRLPGDDREFTAFRFSDHTDAMLFKTRFEGWGFARHER